MASKRQTRTRSSSRQQRRQGQRYDPRRVALWLTMIQLALFGTVLLLAIIRQEASLMEGILAVLATLLKETFRITFAEELEAEEKEAE